VDGGPGHALYAIESAVEMLDTYIIGNGFAGSSGSVLYFADKLSPLLALGGAHLWCNSAGTVIQCNDTTAFSSTADCCPNAEILPYAASCGAQPAASCRVSVSGAFCGVWLV